MMKSKTKGIAAKVAADQLIFEPPFMTLFFTITSLLENRGPLAKPLSEEEKKESVFDKITEKIRHEIVTTYLIDCCVWPTVQVALALESLRLLTREPSNIAPKKKGHKL